MATITTEYDAASRNRADALALAVRTLGEGKPTEDYVKRAETFAAFILDGGEHEDAIAVMKVAVSDAMSAAVRDVAAAAAPSPVPAA